MLHTKEENESAHKEAEYIKKSQMEISEVKNTITKFLKKIQRMSLAAEWR